MNEKLSILLAVFRICIYKRFMIAPIKNEEEILTEQLDGIQSINKRLNTK